MRTKDTSCRSHKGTGKLDRLHEVAPSRLKRHHDGEGRQPTKGALMTTAEVAAAMGICEQRVRQLEASAIRKLREFTALREHVQ